IRVEPVEASLKDLLAVVLLDPEADDDCVGRRTSYGILAVGRKNLGPLVGRREIGIVNEANRPLVVTRQSKACRRLAMLGQKILNRVSSRSGVAVGEGLQVEADFHAGRLSGLEEL